MKDLKVILLGSGTSDGVPLIGCNCPVCLSPESRNKRKRTSLWLHNHDQSISILFDCGPDFREQALGFGIKRLDGVFITHTHWDHIAGLNDLRPLAKDNGIKGRDNPIPIMVLEEHAADLINMFPYIFKELPQLGGGIPSLQLQIIDIQQGFKIKDIQINPIIVKHGQIDVLGFRFLDIGYLTDVNFVSQESKFKLQGLRCLFLDALRFKEHPTHFNLDQALSLSSELNPLKTILVHTTHDLDYLQVNQSLPSGVELGYDGLVIKI